MLNFGFTFAHSFYQAQPRFPRMTTLDLQMLFIRPKLEERSRIDRTIRLVKVSSCSNTGIIKDGPY